ncbi:MAG: MraY family glycosyltransferase [Rikenellaceae bacterium]
MLSLKKRLLDRIDARKVHSVPASRLGGISFYPSIMLALWITSIVGMYIYPDSEIICFDKRIILECTAIMALYLVAIYDDILEVAYRKKFVIQIFAATCIVVSGTYFTSLNGVLGIYDIPSYVGIPITIFLLVFITNSINLIDGIDGLASSLSIIALLTYGVVFLINDAIMSSIFAFATLGALAPFCYNNIFGIRKRGKSKIFMGDAGALVIGAILGFMAVQMWEMQSVNGFSKNEHFASILAITVLLIPCLDVIRIIIHRFRDHKPLFLPDKNHIHHKFLSLGFSARKSLLSILTMDIFFIMLNLLLTRYFNLTIIIIVDVLMWTVIHIVISKKILKHNSAK